jgi:twinkle protein
MSKSKIVGDTACPECTSRGKDSTGNHLIIFENEQGERSGYCNRCTHYIPPKDFDPSKYKPASKKTKTPEQIQAELDEVADCPISELKTRKISEATAERYNVRLGFSEFDGSTPQYHFYPKTKEQELVAYKVRCLNPKLFWAIGGNAQDCDLFGIEQAKRSDVGNQYLWITEDELSAMSAYQVLNEYSKTANKPAVVSLPDGTDSASVAVGRELDWINTFKTVVLVMDTDEAGKKATETILKLVPHAKVVELPPLKLKREGIDPNDYLLAGKGRELFNMLLFRQDAPKIEGLVTIEDCLAEALTKPEFGLSYPWDDLNELTFGQRVGEIIGVGGGVGCGKTLLAHSIAAHNWQVHNEASFLIMLEENNGDTVKNVAGKVDGIPYHRPDCDFDIDQLRSTALAMKDHVFLWRSNINQAIRYDFDKIKAAIRYHAMVNNVKHIFFDNITAATQHLTPSEINTEVGA